MNSFHWILLVIEIDRSYVTVLDSKRIIKEEYQSLIDLLNKAWALLIKKHPGPFKDELAIPVGHSVLKGVSRPLLKVKCPAVFPKQMSL